VAALVTILFVLHPNSAPSDSLSRRSFAGIAIKFFFVVIGGIPWIMVNEENQFGIKRLQSWVLFVLFVGVVVYLLIVFPLAIVLCIPLAIWSLLETVLELCCSYYKGPNTGDSVADSPHSVLSPRTNEKKDPSPKMTTGALHEVRQTSEKKPVTGAASSISIPEEGKAKIDLSKISISTPAAETNSEATNPNIIPDTALSEPARHLMPQTPKKKHSYFIRLRSSWRIWKRLGKYRISNYKAVVLLPFINLLYLIWSILAIEFTIKWNNITGVDTIQSVGQLIPFIIGTIGFLKLARDISVERTGIWLYKLVIVSVPISTF
jgi:hypothetical protein